MHECTSHLESFGKVILPIKTNHRLSLHTIIGVAFKTDVYIGAGIKQTLIKNCNNT